MAHANKPQKRFPFLIMFLGNHWKAKNQTRFAGDYADKSCDTRPTRSLRRSQEAQLASHVVRHLESRRNSRAIQFSFKR